MYRILRNRRILLCGLLSGLQINEDEFEKYKEARGFYIDDPIERVKLIFLKDSQGNFHPELLSAINSAQMGMIGGILFGGIIQAQKETHKFFRVNETTIFFGNKDAIRYLIRTNMLAVCKGAIKWGPRFGLFLGSYSLVSSCCELYRNKFGLVDNIVAGSTIGALNRFMFGIKGMISGGFFGGILGILYGFTILTLNKVGNVDHLEFKYAEYTYIKSKDEINSSELKNDTEYKEVLESGSHVVHIPNPLNMLEDEEKKS